METKTLKELETMLDNGEVTSLQLVQYFLKRIATYDQANLKLNSIAEINPNVEIDAIIADQQRARGEKKSPLHGIPIVLKDNINATGGMHTTAGSLALADLFAPYDATVTKQLKDAGMIILGKANLSEFAYFMSDDMPCGYSSRGGQVISPYHDYIDPSGSSTGSAVAVAAGMIPVAIGTETNGSLTSPSEKNNIVTLKPTVGMVSRWGIVPISSKQDTAGPMAKTVHDCALLMNYLYKKDEHDVYTMARTKECYDFLKACDEDVSKLKIGFLSFDNRAYNEEEQAALDEAKSLFEKVGCETKCVSLENRYVDNMTTLVHEFKSDLNIYLDTVRGHTKMTSLKDIIEFNKEDLETRAKFNQAILEMGEATDGTFLDPAYLEAREKQMKHSFEVLELMKKEGLDVVCTIHAIGHAPVAGFPALSVPCKSLTDLKPMNIVFYAPHFKDDILFTAASYYESQTHYRVAPNLNREVLEVERDGGQWTQKYMK